MGSLMEAQKRDPPRRYSVANVTRNGADHRYDADTALRFAWKRTKGLVSDGLVELLYPEAESHPLGFLIGPAKAAVAPVAFVVYAATAPWYQKEPVWITEEGVNPDTHEYFIKRSDGSETRIALFDTLPGSGRR